MRLWLRKFALFLLALSLLFPIDSVGTSRTSTKAKTKSIKKETQKISNKSSKKTSKSKKSRKRTRVFVRKVALNQVSILETRELATGVFYKKYKFGKEPLRILVHVVEVDIDSTPYGVKVLKAKNSIDGLDYLKNIYEDYQFELTRIYGGELLALANANFWSAFMNYPIGILVSEGEVISMRKYKEWSSIFFDESNRPYIDNFELSGELILPNNKILSIDNVNRRRENDFVVLYNKYIGDSIPKVHIEDLDKLVQETISSIISNVDVVDSNEVEIDTNEIRNQILNARKQESIEFSTKKLRFRYLEPPAINQKVKVEFLGMDSGVVHLPPNGFVLSIPQDYTRDLKLKIGDQCYLHFATDRLRYIKFTNAVSGTPRLVRKGIAKHEAYQEGSRGYRFIGSQLPRTAIGTNMSKTRIYLFVVEVSRTNNSLGANLSQLSYIAKKIGCYDAMNLDGGGSSILFVQGKRVNGVEGSNGRKISVAIGISTK